jgi:hypothetical protein
MRDFKAFEANMAKPTEQILAENPDLTYDPVIATIVVNERELARLLPSEDDFDLCEVNDFRSVLRVLPTESSRRDFLSYYLDIRYL